MRNVPASRAHMIRAALLTTAFFALPHGAWAADLGSLSSVEHGGTVIEEGDTVLRDELVDIDRVWTFRFNWPHEVENSRGFFATFRGTFGGIEGGIPVEGENYAVSFKNWNEFNPNLSTHILGLPALGELDTASSTYTVVVAELSEDFAIADTVEWFTSGGTSGVEPENYATLTFLYDSSFTPEDLNSIHFVEHGGKRIVDGDVIFRSELSVNDDRWTYNFDWPREVENQRALFAVFRGTFGDLDGVPNEGENYAVSLQNWREFNPKSSEKFMNIPPLLDEDAIDGTYTAMVAERDPKYLAPENGFSLADQVEWFASGGSGGIPPLAYSFLEFQFFRELELDPLLLEFEPVLYLHPEENYQPMNVEAFIEASALWDDNGLLSDTLVKQESDADPVTVNDVAVPGDSQDWYLAFSDSENPKSFDVDAALTEYEQLVAGGEAVPTYYARRMDDHFFDDEGVRHDFIVLQYWYFYAFNDWQEHGGLNNHEGDWETVMVFLDADTKEPEYVAYSAHLNDGDPDGNFFQFDSVRRDWDSNEVTKDGGQVVSLVARGSHANYPNNGNNGEHAVFPPIFFDTTSITGPQLHDDIWIKRKSISRNLPLWMKYEGQWGTDADGVGEQGPQGPAFIAPILGDGVARFNEPVKWAGIDQDGSKIISTITNTLKFTGQLTSFVFREALETGVEVAVDLHDESITFGNNLGSASLLPHFWDIESSLENDTFDVEVALQYDSNELEALDTNEGSLSVFLYNEAENLWKRLRSTVDVATDTVSFETTHFSRYAIGAPSTPGELLMLFRERVEDADMKKAFKNRLFVGSEAAEKHIDEGRVTAAQVMLRDMQKFIEGKKEKGIPESDNAEALLGILEDVDGAL